MSIDLFFEHIKSQFNKQLPFVVYRKPNDNKVNGIFQNNSELHFTKDFSEKGFVFSPFDNTQKTVLIPFEVSNIISASYSASNEIQKFNFDNSINNESKEFHVNLIKKGVEAIENKIFKKVVLSRRDIVDLSENNPIAIFKSLLRTYKSAFVYCWFHPKVGLWLGATPETLIKIEGKRFSIMALAGTQNYEGSLEVIWQDKEIQEQQFVTDFIVDNLRPHVERYEVSNTETVKAGNLVHLKTMISANLKPKTYLSEVIDALHPTPAVCGLPKESAKTFILENEKYNREYYTGFLGELNFENKIAPRSGRRNIENRAYAIKRNSTQLYVNLRCMQIKNQQAIIYVGGGITQSSEPEKEWEETVSKSLVIKSVL
jgi:isochorismate synthase